MGYSMKFTMNNSEQHSSKILRKRNRCTSQNVLSIKTITIHHYPNSNFHKHN